MPGIVAKEYSDAPAQLRAVLPPEAFQAFSQSFLPFAEDAAAKLMEMLVPRIREIMCEKFEELIGILCLTESPTNLLMWAHYADSHAGFVLELVLNPRSSTSGWAQTTTYAIFEKSSIETNVQP